MLLTGIPDIENFVFLVRNEADEELLFGLEDGGVGERLIADLVESIGSIGDDFTKEHFFVGVESVDDQGHKLRNLSLESEGLSSFGHCDMFMMRG